MNARTLGYGALLVLAAAALPACAASDSNDESNDPQGGTGGDGGSDQVCVPGHQTTCSCPGGDDGVQVCLPDGSGLDACDCGPSGTGGTGGGETDACGDGFCGDGEDCHTCEDDCPPCEPCDIAPSCDNAQIPPQNLPHSTEFDVPKMDWVSPEQLQQRLAQYVQEAAPEMRVLAAALATAPARDEHPYVGALREVFAAHPGAAEALRTQLGAAGMGAAEDYRQAFPERRLPRIDGDVQAMDVVYPGGTMECGAPLLRLNVAKITVHEEDDDFANDIVYCLIQAETAAGAEIRITPQTPNLDEGESFEFSLETSVFWGQQGPTTPAGNMLITYDCVEADTSNGYQDLIDAIGGAATQIGDVVEGENGWIFTTAGAIAPIVSSGLALDGDDHLFNAQQTIPLDKQLELSNGAYWTVRREGTHLNSDWDWELFIHVWGCAEYGTL
ncbi:MAG: hypothetical protein DRI90_23340 [Deltaproteobacteria bacterium]|nr:MAG: hypothetical protein DRI90_23340 [Deltaproteobacteria bacterium]